MFHKTIDIVKARWPEVILVVVLQAAMMLLIEKMTVIGEAASQAQAAMMPFWSSFLLGVGLMLFAILWQIIYLGFLKTAAVSGEYPQHPMQLLQWGRPYFWRIFFFQILLGLAIFVLNSILLSLLMGLFWPNSKLEQVPAWAVQMSGLAGVLILLKPMLLIPAVILVYDVTIIESFFDMRRFQLFRIEPILKVVTAGFVMIIVTALLTGLAQSETPVYYMVMALHHTVFSMVFLVLTLMAVLWAQQRYEAECVEVEEVDE